MDIYSEIYLFSFYDMWMHVGDKITNRNKWRERKEKRERKKGVYKKSNNKIINDSNWFGLVIDFVFTKAILIKL